jgi:hypothetical protein
MIVTDAPFRLVGDGVTDSTAGFLALRDRLLTDREREWEVEFPPGHYLTRAPHWLDGVGRVRLIGHGAKLQQATANRGLFSGSEPFRTLVFDRDGNVTSRSHNPGVRIASVDAGATVLTALDPITAAPGAVALLGGYVQQTEQNHLPIEQRKASGWPPNLRWFEYVRVAAVDGQSVVLSRPLAHAYDAGWRDYPGDYFGAYTAGAPRLYLCNRPPSGGAGGFDIPIRVEMRGFSFARAAGSDPGAGGIGFKPALELLLLDCTIRDDLGLDCFVQMNDRVTLRRCMLDDLEIDKCLRHVLIDDCEIASLTSDGAGALGVEVKGSRIHGDFRINPRTSVVIDGATAFKNFSLNAKHGGYYTTDPFVMSVRATRP